MKEKGIDAIEGSIYTKPIKELKNNFSVVCSFALLEHLILPQKAIENMLEYLEDNGRLFIWIPLYSKMGNDNSPIVNNFNQEHINYFSTETLSRLLENNGAHEEKHYIIKVPYTAQSYTYGVLGIYIKGNKVAELSNRRDETTKKSIQEYWDRQNNKEETIKNKLSLLNTGSIAIWGTGVYVRNLIRKGTLDLNVIDFFIDNNPLKQGKIFFGKKFMDLKISRIFTGPLLLEQCCMLTKYVIK